MSGDHGYGRHARILRALRLIERSNGVLPSELATIGGCVERTVHRDILIMRKAGENIVCRNGRYYLLEGRPDPNDDPLPPKQKQQRRGVSWNIFRKWYKADVRDGDWYVVRADQKDDPGYKVGRVLANGKKNFYLNAAAIVRERNHKILAKRQAMIEQLLAAGWTQERIDQKVTEIRADIRQELGDNYQEDMP